VLAGGETGPFRRCWEDRGPKRAEPCGEVVRPIREWNRRAKTEIPVTFLTDQQRAAENLSNCGLYELSKSCRDLDHLQPVRSSNDETRCTTDY
jgi:hypothetical protein